MSGNPIITDELEAALGLMELSAADTAVDIGRLVEEPIFTPRKKFYMKIIYFQKHVCDIPGATCFMRMS